MGFYLGTDEETSFASQFSLGEDDFSNHSFNERLEDGDTLPGLKGWGEKAGMFALEMVPFAKYVMPDEQDKFMKLDPEEQTKALFWESFGVALMVGAPLVTKPLGKGLRFLGKGLLKPFQKVFKPLPIEDALAGIKKVAPSFEMKPFNFREIMQGKLQGKGMTEAEGRWLVDSLEGSVDEIPVFAGVGLGGKTKTKPFLEVTEEVLGRSYPTRKIKPDFKMRYSEGLVRGQYYNRQFESALKTELLRVNPKEEVAANLTQVIFDTMTEKLWPATAKQMGFGTIGEAEMANVVHLMLTDKAGAQGVLMAGMKHLMPLSWMPARVAFGTGEAPWQTITKVYNPTKDLFETTNRYHFNKILEWAKMLEQSGLATVEKHPAKGFKLKKVNFTAMDQKLAQEALIKRDDLMFTAVRSGEEKAVIEARTAVQKVTAAMGQGPAKELVMLWDRYSDKLYSEYIIHQIPRVFRKAGFSGDGMAQVQALMRGLEPKIKQLFATSSSRNASDIFLGVKEILGEARELLKYSGEGGHHYLSKIALEEQPKVLEKLAKALTPRGKESGGDFLPYLENYTARMAERQAGVVAEWSGAIAKKVGQAGFTKSRYLETFAGKPLDFSSMIEARTYAQAKELFLFDGLKEVMKYAEGLPPAWAEYIEHWLSRALNRPSVTDIKTAMMLQKSVGAVERLFGKTGLWDEHRVMKLASNLNNITYMGALGFKPFSVIRNLFQPLLLVPADLGGMKDMGTLIKGAARAMDPKVRDYIIKIGGITDYAPEITMRPHALPFGKPGVFGMSQQMVDQLRDASLWAFRGSDRWNRYTTGAAAMTKWEKSLAKVGLKGEVEIFPKNLVDDFARKVNLNGRQPWKAQEIKDLLWRGQHDNAKAAYVKDVIADTQYLYGTLNAPVVTGGSAVARTGFIFQTWWMNYLTTMEKWMRTGDGGGAKVNRLLTGMISAAIAEQLMEPVWGRKTAMKAVGLGPAPTQVMIPPAWRPIYEGVAALMTIQDPEVSKKHAVGVIRSLSIFAPGGLIVSDMIRGAKKEGFEGFLKKIVKYQPDEE